MHFDSQNPAFAWTDGPLARSCVTFVAKDGTPFQVPKETIRLALERAARSGEKVPTYKQFLAQLSWFDTAKPRK